jgi:hypothetical protein
VVAGHGDSMMTGAGVGKEDVEASPEVSATLTVLRAQGLPPCVCALQGLNAVPAKRRMAAGAYTRPLFSST